VPAEGFAGATLARILRPHGRRGEVAAEILTDFPERLASLREAYLWDGKNEPRRTAVRSCWLHKNQAIFHFAGCQGITEAEKLRGLEVQVPLAERMPLPPGRYYISDLTGCDVWEREGRRLGSVREVLLVGEDTPGTPVLAVETPGGELLVPFAEEICTRIDTAARRIDVALPDGLRELNRQT